MDNPNYYNDFPLLLFNPIGDLAPLMFLNEQRSNEPPTRESEGTTNAKPNNARESSNALYPLEKQIQQKDTKGDEKGKPQRRGRHHHHHHHHKKPHKPRRTRSPTYVRIHKNEEERSEAIHPRFAVWTPWWKQEHRQCHDQSRDQHHGAQWTIECDFEKEQTVRGATDEPGRNDKNHLKRKKRRHWQSVL